MVWINLTIVETLVLFVFLDEANLNEYLKFEFSENRMSSRFIKVDEKGFLFLQ